jgi:Flp pilus assembly protein TadD
MTFYRITAVLIFGVVAATADVDRGRQLYREGKYAEAESELKNAVRDQGDNAAANRLLGLALIEQDKASEAEGPIKKAYELEQNDDNKVAMARLHIAQKEFDKAEELLKDASSGEGLEYTRGLLHLHRKNYEAAAKDLESAVEKDPENAYAHYYAGMAYNGLKRPDKMLSHFQLFVKMRPDAPEARKVRAILQTGR